MSKEPTPKSGAEKRRLLWVRLRNRVRGSMAGSLTNFLPFFLQLPLLVAIAVAVPVYLGSAAIDLYQRQGYNKARIAHVDDLIAKARTANGSPYCRAIFGVGPLYGTCTSGERHSLAQFSRAWTAGKGLSTIRDHMIGCLESAQKEQGTSWHIAAVCSGADQPSPADTYSE